MRPIISVRNLSKQYRIGAKQAAYGTLRDSIAGALRNPFRRNGSNSDDNTIWALKDISFDVMPGEVVGIIGRNGAGKSTLLKILSRITEPTSGEIDIYGRVGSLLEVGTGFHAELSGRENIYLNGAVLGMKRREIDRKFDEIVDFAEIEKFIDTPVKHYSSGMYMRLAFAVAAHLEPEILIVDEVLAVGDITFQKKCLGKMGEVSRKGRTVFFDCHTMNAINSLCSKAILLMYGMVDAIGEKSDVVDRYVENVSRLADTNLATRTDRTGNGRMVFKDYFLEDWEGNRLDVLRSGQDVVIAAAYSSSDDRDLNNVSVAFAVLDSFGNQFTDLGNRYTNQVWSSIPASGVIRCFIPRLPLMPGLYTFGVYAEVNGAISDWMINAGRFEVEVGDFYQTGRLLDRGQGTVMLEQQWQISESQAEGNNQHLSLKESSRVS